MGRWMEALRAPKPTDKTDTTDITAVNSVSRPLQCPEIEGAASPSAIVQSEKSSASKPVNEVHDLLAKLEGDLKQYASALSREGPCGYGGIATSLGWGASRASAVEKQLREKGWIAYDRTGRGTLTCGGAINDTQQD